MASRYGFAMSHLLLRFRHVNCLISRGANGGAEEPVIERGFLPFRHFQRKAGKLT
jgi:hypothetical protein